ncbi:uncharacterized protein LOC111361844 [Spodoptera litura]|uniref:Uncharacterized protein LOC111361844 n=1 Tax=Spodoptera litura TaxID=69820 RepID=A0A9J7EM42_SPOLT|nr:uncharacterized protein LOC111361844 [Spodoptera litura]
MAARAIVASCALLAFAGVAYAQDAVVIVDVSNRTLPNQATHGAHRNHGTHGAHTTGTHANIASLDDCQSIVTQLVSAKEEALLLYTDFASRAGNDLKTFLKNITGYADGIIQNVNAEPPLDDVDECWVKFQYRVKKVEHDAQRAAMFSGDSHHKFLLGHMIVFRMHLNKSEDYLKRCDKATRGCGLSCETTPRVRRWRRLALDEIHRVREDMPFTRRSYRDLVSHARRKLNHLKKQIIVRSRDAMEDYRYCINRRRLR